MDLIVSLVTASILKSEIMCNITVTALEDSTTFLFKNYWAKEGRLYGLQEFWIITEGLGIGSLWDCRKLFVQALRQEQQGDCRPRLLRGGYELLHADYPIQLL